MVLPRSVDTPIVRGGSLHLYGCDSEKNNFLLLSRSVDTPIVRGASLHCYGCNSDKNYFVWCYLDLLILHSSRRQSTLLRL